MYQIALIMGAIVARFRVPRLERARLPGVLAKKTDSTFFTTHVCHLFAPYNTVIHLCHITQYSSITTISQALHPISIDTLRPVPPNAHPLVFDLPFHMDRFLAPHSPEAQAHSLVTFVYTLMSIHAYNSPLPTERAQ